LQKQFNPAKPAWVRTLPACLPPADKLLARDWHAGSVRTQVNEQRFAVAGYKPGLCDGFEFEFDSLATIAYTASDFASVIATHSKRVIIQEHIQRMTRMNTNAAPQTSGASVCFVAPILCCCCCCCQE
jgi:hypothetical protein